MSYFLYFAPKERHILNSSVKMNNRENGSLFPNVESAAFKVSLTPFPSNLSQLGGWIPGNPWQPCESGAKHRNGIADFFRLPYFCRG